MPTNYKRLYLLTGSILVFVCCVFACVGAGLRYYKYSRDYNSRYPSQQSPIRTLSIQIDEDQYEELFSQLEKFSAEHQLEFYLAFYNNRETFSVFMEGKGISIAVVSFVNTPELNFRFFEEDPTNPPSQETVYEVLNDLESFISEIPNVVIVEEE